MDVKCCHSFICSSGIYWLSTMCHTHSLFITEKNFIKSMRFFCFVLFCFVFRASLMDQMVKSLQETQVWSLSQEYSWRRKWQPIPVFSPGESHGQRSFGGYVHGVTKVGHNWATNTHSHTLAHTMRFLLLFIFTFFILQEMNKTQCKKKKWPPYWDLYSK